MRQLADSLANARWALLRGNLEVGSYSHEQLHAMTLSGQLLPLDLLRETLSGEVLPAGKLLGLFPAPGERSTPVPGSLPAQAGLPVYLTRKARGIHRWQSRRTQIALCCLVGLMAALAGPWAEGRSGIFNPSALGISALALLGVVFFAWSGLFFRLAATGLAGASLTLLAILQRDERVSGWGFWLCVATTCVLGAAGVARLLRKR
jgi:ABC-type Fe3+-siderophore transport system permease subunit